MATEIVDIEGHIVDSLILAKVLDAVVAAGGDYRVLDLDLGRSSRDPSRAAVEVTHTDPDRLRALVAELAVHGANRRHTADATLAPAPADGVAPSGFHATTNLPTQVLVGGRWLEVANPEMDCVLVVADVDGAAAARTAPLHRLRAGDRVVVGEAGVRTTAPPRPPGPHPFAFMTSAVSSEKPQANLAARVAAELVAARADGRRVAVVAGPAVVHTGGAPHLAALVARGLVDVVFAGNGFATHDLEAQVLGTSLGVALGPPGAGGGLGLAAGTAGGPGHSNHLRVINEVRRLGSIAAAVATGYVTGGVMAACVRAGVPFVLAGSVRDDGPLPDVITDVVAAADAMRAHLEGVGVVLMLASTLHAIATGNLLPAGVATYCVDINPAVATKLADRGSHQALGIVTDVGLFLERLARTVEDQAMPA